MENINYFGEVDYLPEGNPFFEIKFLNLDKIFYDIYVFLGQLFSSGGQGGDLGLETTRRGFGFGDWFNFGGNSSASSGSSFYGFFNFFENFLYFLIILLLTIIIYVIVRMFEIRKREEEYTRWQIEEYKRLQAQKGSGISSGNGMSPKNSRWSKVLEHLFSDSQADWKLAIIDADSMLDDLMDQLGFKGENLGEKLKNANRDNFRNLSAAWEAHTIRNRIAHEGLAYDLSIREARKVIALYEQVFREFDYI